MYFMKLWKISTEAVDARIDIIAEHCGVNQDV
jgi:hypothetical protein